MLRSVESVPFKCSQAWKKSQRLKYLTVSYRRPPFLKEFNRSLVLPDLFWFSISSWFFQAFLALPIISSWYRQHAWIVAVSSLS